MTANEIYRAQESDKPKSDVNCLIIAQNKLFTGSDDGIIKCWSLELKLLVEVQAHKSSIYAFATSQEALFSCSDDGSVKEWDFELLPKRVILEDGGCEFWTVQFEDNVLYFGDQEGNVRIYKNGTFYGMLNVAAGVKSMLLFENLLLTSRNSDVVVSNLRMDGPKLQFGIKATLPGHSPLEIIDSYLLFVDNSGKGVILNRFDSKQQHKIVQVHKLENAHEMIINSIKGVKINEQYFIITGGWDKVVKKWTIVNEELILAAKFVISFVINSLVVKDLNKNNSENESCRIYVGGNGGNVICL